MGNHNTYNSCAKYDVGDMSVDLSNQIQFVRDIDWEKEKKIYLPSCCGVELSKRHVSGILNGAPNSIQYF